MKNTAYFGPRPQLRPRILAHRGLTFVNNEQAIDENTLLAFEQALKVGADYLETDIQVTRDGVPVLFHDPGLKRLAGKKIKIQNLDFSELKKATLPRGGFIPSLEEALITFPEARFNLDIKNHLAETPAAAIINRYQAHNRVLISSFSAASRKRTLLNLQFPVATSPGRSEVINIYLRSRVGMLKSAVKLINEFSALQIPVRKSSLDFLNPDFLDTVLKTETELHFWTINNPETMTELFSLGAHGIVTDRSDIAKQVFS